MSEKDLLQEVLKDLDEIKRYVANVYSNTDTEVGDIKSTVEKIERQLNETDRQVDRIETFERKLNDMHSTLKNLERKVK
ncbi:MAG: hypothetical protein AAGA45_05300 [Verrucomicrobiota bacterium]